MKLNKQDKKEKEYRKLTKQSEDLNPFTLETCINYYGNEVTYKKYKYTYQDSDQWYDFPEVQIFYKHYTLMRKNDCWVRKNSFSSYKVIINRINRKIHKRNIKKYVSNYDTYNNYCECKYFKQYHKCCGKVEHLEDNLYNKDYIGNSWDWNWD